MKYLYDICEGLNLLVEARSSHLIVIDIQPNYCETPNHELRHVAKEETLAIIDHINKDSCRSVLFFYNGDGCTPDTEKDVKEFLFRHGLDKNSLRKISFREKGFGFLRDWMDGGVPEDEIIKAIRYMVLNHLNQSTEIDVPELNHRSSGIIYVPDNISLRELKTYNSALIGGGYRSKCFREITLLMNAFNIKYREVKNMIYDE